MHSKGVQQSLFSGPEEDERPAPAVTAYTDGGCDPNPGPGGWAALLRFPEHEVALDGNDPQATNNQMELEAAIAALIYLAGRYGACVVDLYTDSTYLRQGIDEWIEGWFVRGWKTKGGQAVKNQALWRRLYDLAHVHQVHWHWVKGHAGDPFNERVDLLAGQARRRLFGMAPGQAGAPAPFSPPEPTDERPCPPAELSIGASCQGSAGAGAWAAVLRVGGECRVLSDWEAETTSNLLLLQAAIAGLESLGEPCPVTVYTDSDYVGRGASQWVWEWQRRQWTTKTGRPVKNREHWEALLAAARRHQVTWQVVRGEPLPADLVQAKEAAAHAARGGTQPEKGTAAC